MSEVPTRACAATRAWQNKPRVFVEGGRRLFRQLSPGIFAIQPRPELTFTLPSAVSRRTLWTGENTGH
jgi:hypothetical protein